MTIAEDLARALAGVLSSAEDPRIGWAWMDREYRTSRYRSFQGHSEALTFTDQGLAALEAAVAAILKAPGVRGKWLEEDVWTTVLSLMGYASHEPQVDLERALDKILQPRPTRTFAALANVTWGSDPATLGTITIARISSESDSRALSEYLELTSSEADALHDHSRQLLGEFGSYVVASGVSERQGELAQSDFDRLIEDAMGLTLLLSDNLDDHGLVSMRGATNRPGIRGLALDRSALGDRLKDEGAGELGARLLVITGWSSSNAFRWYSADPLPLDQVLAEPVRQTVSNLLSSQDPIAQRVRLAARWYARAVWSKDDDDAALAVSVGLDAMLTGKEAVPGAVSKGRFALLERDVFNRMTRLKRYDDVYKVRNAIAHGGDPGRGLVAVGGVRSMLADARWVANQLVVMRREFNPVTDAELRAVWDGIQWGSLPWAGVIPRHANPVN